MTKSNPLERAFKILDVVASSGREMSLVEIVNACNLPQSSTFRLASNLVESSMLAFDTGTKTYRVGRRADRLSLFISGQKGLKETIGPALDALARTTHETSFFVSAAASGNKLIDYVVPEIGAQIFIHPGFKFPFHATAAGKVIQAFSDWEITEADLQALERFQPETELDPDRLKDILTSVRSNGYATNDSELDKDVYSMCVPVFYKKSLAGALGIVGPKFRMVEGHVQTLEETVDLLQTTSAEISALLVA